MTLPLNEKVNTKTRQPLINWLAIIVVLLFIVFAVPPGSIPYPPRAAVSDAAIAHWPAANHLRTSVWEHGQWPLWNQSHMLGLPFAANPLNKVWYPPQWLALIVPPTLHLNLMIYAHMVLLVLGMLRWAKDERLNPAVGFLAAIAWGLNPKLIGHAGAGHLDIVYALAWVPWLFISMRNIFRRPDYRHIFQLSSVTALLALADVRIAFYFIPVAGAYGLATLVDERRNGGASVPRKLFVMILISAVLFALLFAVQLLPLLAYSNLMSRSIISVNDAAAFSLPLRYLTGMLIPDYGGFHEWMVYSSVTVLSLAILGVISWQSTERRMRIIVACIIAAAALLWALGSNGPIFELVARNIPLVSWFRVPSRALFIVSFCLIIVAAYGFNDLMLFSTRAARLLGFGNLIAGLTWLVGVLVFVDRTTLPILAGVGATLIGSGAGLWLSGGGLSRYTWGKPSGIWLLVITLTLSLVAVDTTLIEGRYSQDIEETDRMVLERISGEAGRIYSPSYDLVGIESAQAEVLTVHGVDPFQYLWSAEAISRASGSVLDHYCVTLPCWQYDYDEISGEGSGTPDIEALRALGTRWIVSDFPVNELAISSASRVADLYIYDLGEIVDSELRRMPDIVRSPNVAFDGLVDTTSYDETVVLTIVQAYAPGWKAVVDGKRVDVLRVEEALTGIELAPGRVQHVRLVYRPTIEYVGMLISGLTAIIVVALVIILRNKEP